MDEAQKNVGTPAGLSAPVRFMITAAAFVIVVAGMRAAVEIIIPFLLSVFVAIICTPALFWLKHRGISTVFAILIISFVIIMAGVLIGGIVTTSIADFTNDLPRYTTELNTTIQNLEEQWNAWLDDQREKFNLNEKDEETPDEAVEEPTLAPAAADTPKLPPKVAATPAAPSAEAKPALSVTQFINTGAAIDMMRNLLAQFGSILTKGFLIYLTTIFILMEASILPGKIRASMTNNSGSFEDLAGIADDVKKYLAMKTVISLVTGILVALWLMVLKVKYPIVWGLIAFLMNFVPNIGSILAAVPACILAFLQLGFGTAALAAVGYLILNIVLGNLVEPRLMGQRLGLSTLVVFLSLVFWGWVLGPIGMLLSVPLTMAVKIVLQSHPDTSKLALLLDSQKPPAQE